MTNQGQGDDLIPTKATLLGRLKNSKDQSSWQEFFDTYSKLIYDVARKAGLSEADAQHVLQATMVSVADRMPTFKYDSRNGSFKSWLLNLTRLQIVTLTLKRRPSSRKTSAETAEEETETSLTIDRAWETEWEINLLNAAVTNVKRRLDPGKYQIYDLHVNKKWSPEKVAAAFDLSAEEVLAAKRDITEMIQKEAKRLEQQML